MKNNKKKEVFIPITQQKFYLLLMLITILVSSSLLSSCGKDEKDSSISAPTGLEAVQDGDEILITWNSVDNASTYKVYRSSSSSGSYSLIGTTTSSYKYDTSPLIGDNYYRVTAVSSSNTESSRSNYTSCYYSSGGGTISAPEGLNVFQDDNQILLIWYPVPDASSYNIYRSSSSSGSYSLIETTTSFYEPWIISYDTSPLNGDNYYKVSAVNGNGEESNKTDYAYCYYSSGGGSISAPTGLEANQNGSQIHITWNSVPTASSYKVYRSSSSSGSYSLIGTTTSTYKYDTSPITGYNYYKVTAINSSGTESDMSNYVSCNYSSGGGSILPPTGLDAAQDGSQIYITWNSVSNASSYKVYRSSSATGSYFSIGTATSTYKYDNSPITGYNYYKVTAINSSGTESDMSNYVSCNYSSGGTTVPSAPTGITVSNEGNAYNPMIVVRWNDVSEATSYKVYRSNSANGTYSQIGSATSYTVLTDDSPRTGDNYYKVKAINSAGESPYSNYAHYNHDPSGSFAPCPVTYGNCTVSGSTMTMRWSVSTSTGCGKPTTAYLRVRNPISGVYADVQTLSGTATSASFAFGPWIDSDGYVFVGIVLENENGTSGGTPRVYDTINKKWIN